MRWSDKSAMILQNMIKIYFLQILWILIRCHKQILGILEERNSATLK